MDGLHETFETIAAMPGIGRKHREFDPPVRVHASEEHLVVYIERAGEVSVLRVLGARQDWWQMLRG